MESDPVKRKAMVWAIERKLTDDVVRPVIFHNVIAACWQPYVKHVTIMVNSVNNGWRWEDLRLDKQARHTDQSAVRERGPSIQQSPAVQLGGLLGHGVGALKKDRYAHAVIRRGIDSDLRFGILPQ